MKKRRNKTDKGINNKRLAIYLFSLVVAILVAYAGYLYIQNLERPIYSYQSLSETNSPTPETIPEETPTPTTTTTYLSESIEFNKILQLTDEIELNNQKFAESALAEEKETTLTSLTQIAKERKILVKELMKKNPQLFLSIAIPESKRITFPKDIQKDIEEETAITAKIEVLHIDDFDNPENSRYEYFLNVGKEKLSFYPAKEIYLLSGASVEISGYRLEDVVVSDVKENNFQVLTIPPLDSVGEQKTLVLLVKFLDSGTEPFTPSQIREMIFNSSFQNFMREQSYNKTFFSGDVYGWLTIQETAPPDPCGSILISADVINITNNSINLIDYQRILFIIYHPSSAGGCSFIGKVGTNISGSVYNLSQTWVAGNSPSFFTEPSWWGEQPFQWTSLDFVLAHELGHALGVHHANGWDCGNQILYGDDCQHREYGNYFDAMGIGSYSLHFNSYFKEILGWVEPNRIFTIKKSGTYTINNLESNSGIALAKIQILNTNKTPFYLEYRKGVGFDSNLNSTELFSNQFGLFINWISKEFRPLSSRLLDMSPTSLYWDSDITQTTLNSPDVFEDPGTGIIISPVINTNKPGITFNVIVGAPTCVYHKPIITYSSFLWTTGTAGEDNYILMRIFNQDSISCGQSEFRIVPLMPSSWSYQVSPSENISLSPNEEDYASIQFTVPQNTIPGNYLVKYEVINLASSLKTTKKDSIQVLAPPIGFVPPTPPQGFITANKSIDINVSITTTSLKEARFNWNNESYLVYDEHLILMYNLNRISSLGETSTKVVDLSRYENDGLVYNDASWISNGKYNGAYYFDGMNDFIYTKNSNSLNLGTNDFTIELWIKFPLNGTSYWEGILSKGYSTSARNNTWGIVRRYNLINSIAYQDVNSSSGKFTTTYLSSNFSNGWHYFVVTRKVNKGISTYSFYEDGVLKKTEVKNQLINLTNNYPLMVGMANGRYIKGSVDEIRIWKRALNLDELQQNYNLNLNKFALDKWSLYVKRTNLTIGKHTYSSSIDLIDFTTFFTEKREITIV